MKEEIHTVFSFFPYTVVETATSHIQSPPPPTYITNVVQWQEIGTFQKSHPIQHESIYGRRKVELFSNERFSLK